MPLSRFSMALLSNLDSCQLSACKVNPPERNAATAEQMQIAKE